MISGKNNSENETKSNPLEINISIPYVCYEAPHARLSVGQSVRLCVGLAGRM